jgi:hypothetical protein
MAPVHVQSFLLFYLAGIFLAVSDGRMKKEKEDGFRHGFRGKGSRKKRVF